jgi:hypothetical protein
VFRGTARARVCVGVRVPGLCNLQSVECSEKSARGFKYVALVRAEKGGSRLRQPVAAAGERTCGHVHVVYSARSSRNTISFFAHIAGVYTLVAMRGRLCREPLPFIVWLCIASVCGRLSSHASTSRRKPLRPILSLYAVSQASTTRREPPKRVANLFDAQDFTDLYSQRSSRIT